MANDLPSWECVLRRKGHCKARVRIDLNDHFVEQTNQHTYPSSQTNCKVAKVRPGIKQRSTENVMTNQQILAEQLTRTSEGAEINLAVVENLRQNIRSTLQERSLPQLSINTAAIPVLPIEFQTTTSGDQFLLFDSGAGAADRIIVFALVQARKILTESEIGTQMVILKFVHRFSTNYTLFTRNTVVESFLASLLPSMTEATYRRLMVAMGNLSNGRSPSDILIDFERGAISDIRANSANANVKGCFFHLRSNVWKHLQNIGLQVKYVEQPEFALQLRMLTALAFLPPQDVVRGFAAICNNIRRNFGDVTEQLLVYFEDTYIGRFCVDAPRVNPMLSIELCNIFHRTDAERSQTNNGVEGWQRSFQGHFSSYHPSFARFYGVLKNEESVIRVYILQ